MAQTIRNIEDIRRYKAVLEKKLADYNTDMEENDDCVHNAVVNTVMLENCNEIKMYCGQMALFHNKFYDRVEKETKSSECADESKKMFLTSLSNFISRPNTHLTIFVENHDEIASEDMLNRSLINTALQQNTIEIFKVNENLIFKSSLQHMTVGDKNRMVRWETDKQSHSAQCFFHVDTTFQHNADTLFGYLEKAATQIHRV